MTTQIYWDDRKDQPNEIASYVHCSMCLTEWSENDLGVSPADYSDTQTGITTDGSIQVWCNRHDVNVNIFAFEPREGLIYE